jgi:hypothetical protein
MTSYTEPGQFFCHYTTREAAFSHILPERRLRLSPYSRMRDPLEAKAPALASGLTVPEDPRVQEEMGRAYFEARDEIARLRRQTKLLSLTIDALGYDDEYIADFGRGWARARMWEQYSEQHQGLCLLFRRDAFEPLVLAQLQQRSPGARAGAVRYSKAGLAESPATTLLQREGITGASLAQEHVRRFAQEFFFSKLVDWESEPTWKQRGNRQTVAERGSQTDQRVRIRSRRRRSTECYANADQRCPGTSQWRLSRGATASPSVLGFPRRMRVQARRRPSGMSGRKPTIGIDRVVVDG